MRTVNMLEAKSTLSRLVEAVESGSESEIVIARNGRPAARLMPLKAVSTSKRLGIAKGKFEAPDDIDVHNDLILTLFHGAEE